MIWKNPTPRNIGRRYVRRFGARLISDPRFTAGIRRYDPLEYIERYGRLISAARRIGRSTQPTKGATE